MPVKMISKYVTYLVSFYLILGIVFSEQYLPLSGTNSRIERSLALYLAPNGTQHLNSALTKQIFPSALKGHIFVFLSVLTFEVVGYTLGGKSPF